MTLSCLEHGKWLCVLLNRSVNTGKTWEKTQVFQECIILFPMTFVFTLAIDWGIPHCWIQATSTVVLWMGTPLSLDGHTTHPAPKAGCGKSWKSDVCWYFKRRCFYDYTMKIRARVCLGYITAPFIPWNASGKSQRISILANIKPIPAHGTGDWARSFWRGIREK